MRRGVLESRSCLPRLRKSPTYRVPWLTVTPGGDLKPRDLEVGSMTKRCKLLVVLVAALANDFQDVDIITAWDALRFDTPLKWGVTAVTSALAWICRS